MPIWRATASQIRGSSPMILEPGNEILIDALHFLLVHLPHPWAGKIPMETVLNANQNC